MERLRERPDREGDTIYDFLDPRKKLDVGGNPQGRVWCLCSRGAAERSVSCGHWRHLLEYLRTAADLLNIASRCNIQVKISNSLWDGNDVGLFVPSNRNGKAVVMLQKSTI
jgi:hypothetical protein